MSFYIDVIRADGRRDRFRLGEQQSVIGRDHNAQVSVPDAAELEPQHLLVLPRADGCWVSSVRGARIAPLLDGQRFESGLVAWGSEFDIGSVTVRVLDGDEVERNPGTRRLRLLLILAMGAFALHVFTRSPGQPEIPRPPTAAPVLFDDPTKARCPELTSDPRARGLDLVRDAHARLVRSPYDAQDGITAVALFDQARACLKGQGAADRLQSIAAVRLRLVERLNDDYRMRQLALAQALSEGEYQDARREVRALRLLIAHRPGPYLDWLHRVERLVELRLDRSNKRR